MEIYHRFVAQDQLLIQLAFGDWDTDYYMKYVEKVFKNEKMAQVKKIFSDLRAVNLGQAHEDMKKLLNARDGMVNLNYTSVVIINNPISTAVTHLYQNEVNAQGFNHAYCTTVQEALNILKLDITENEMESFLQEMANNKMI